MTRKHAELERELIEDLLPRTGRSLGDWMLAIDAAGLSEKNEIIDWLRPKGFTFANASWLERIHNNGGRPIYIDTLDIRPLPPRANAAASPPPRVAAVVASPSPSSSAPASAAQPGNRPPAAHAGGAQPGSAPGDGRGGGLAETLARGKAFRPLAEMLLRQIQAALPGVALVVEGDLVRLCHPAEFAVLHVSARELRLGLALDETTTGEGLGGDGLVRARIAGAGPQIQLMIVLTDARQIGAPLLALVDLANKRINAS